MSIWFRPYTLEELDGMSKDSMVEYLDIRFTEIGPDYIRATMPADSTPRPNPMAAAVNTALGWPWSSSQPRAGADSAKPMSRPE